MTRTEAEVLDALCAATAKHARPAEAGDEVDGIAPAFVAAPGSTAEAADVMRIAAGSRLAVVVRGSGTKLGWGQRPAKADLVVDTGRMDRVVEHSAGDLVVHVDAGLRLAALQERLAPAGQRLAVDPVLPPGAAGAGTVGGLIATAASGPLRFSHGAVRDLLIGITVVRADGVVAKAGGKVVKNVAGYDLGKLFAGSWGTLGLVTEAVFRLHPQPVVARWVVIPVDSVGVAYERLRRVLHAQLVPNAVELDRPAGATGALAVLVEGIPQGVAGRVEKFLDLLGNGAEAQETAPEWWGRAPWQRGDVALRLTHQITGLPALLNALDEQARRHGLPVPVRGSAGVGLLYAAVPGTADPAAVAELVQALRDRSAVWGGDVVVLDAPPAVKAALDPWGPVRGVTLMRRVKDQFDPEHRLAPGRFAGGI
ncbi:FAD-binding oxidoreductase [Amycolatopsis sp. FDAARGOS 1241]|uniref:FAD-binding oxidoreductase n=1 Tax=Amycolatopsis sp. FDAARGOS 1241 TaxID=2778070 RepID=UPI001950E1F7|nr:FAD-binding oxidoreductase [Amycolatopsis sp. FDAARGOS 1241]QRP50347.1 FAD-binding oxidoreductase [Amycolatopsis sp. FDAARGOS 1241]